MDDFQFYYIQLLAECAKHAAEYEYDVKLSWDDT